MIQQSPFQLILDTCLYQHQIPIELRQIVHNFTQVRVKFNNDTLKQAVDMWCTKREEALLRYGHISYWDVSEVTYMARLFSGKTTFNDDISPWDVQKVTTFSYMFHGASSFNQPLNTWKICVQYNVKWGKNVAIAVDLSFMFYNAFAFNHH